MSSKPVAALVKDALLWPRWGGVSFEQNESRQFCINPYDKQYEESIATLPDDTNKSTDFMKIIEQSWPRDSTPIDFEAYMARFHIVIFTDTRIIYRFATTDMTTNALVKQWPTPSQPDLFTIETQDILRRYKKDQTYKPDGYDDDFQWDLRLVRALSRNEEIPRT